MRDVADQGEPRAARSVYSALLKLCAATGIPERALGVWREALQVRRAGRPRLSASSGTCHWPPGQAQQPLSAAASAPGQCGQQGHRAYCGRRLRRAARHGLHGL